MGNHFIPQRYLRNFEDPGRPGFIWLHDKRSASIRQAEIAEVAQSKKFYSPETERMLADKVENPGNAVIRKLTAREPISTHERIQLAQYISVMLKRVPASRRRAKEMAPAALKGVVEEVRQQLETLAQGDKVNTELLNQRMLQLDAAEKKFQSKLPPEATAVIESPWPSLEVVQLVYAMTWRVFRAPGPQLFITTDNPAFFFDSFGLGRPQSELTFPLSSTHALHGCWQSKGSDLSFFDASKNCVREFNRRLASRTERLAFYHERAPWLLTILDKKTPYLSRIQW